MPIKQIEIPIQLGEPVEHRGVVVAPLFPRLKPTRRVRDARRGTAARVPRQPRSTRPGRCPSSRSRTRSTRTFSSTTARSCSGAKQNRILNVTVLVAAQSETRIPVSCVEEGRWHARSAAFGAARHAAYPELRRRKAERLSAAPLERGAAQARSGRLSREGWAARRALADRCSGGRLRRARARPEPLRDAFPLQPGQSGALLALGDRFCLDYVSRPRSPASTRSFSRATCSTPSRRWTAAAGDLDAFLAAVAEAPRSRGDSAGLGDDIRLHGESIVGSGLELDGELLQLCAFSTENGEGERGSPGLVVGFNRQPMTSPA